MARRNVNGDWHGLRTLEQALESWWGNVVKTDSCWMWCGNRHLKGYGQFKLPGYPYRVHRASWEIHYGKIPNGLHVLHRCDNPGCVNPEHLFLGTHADNMKDCSTKGRIAVPDQRGEAHSGHKLTLNSVKEIKRLLGTKSHSELGKLFNISRSVITRISLGKLWPHA